jgi:hypothetical protein
MRSVWQVIARVLYLAERFHLALSAASVGRGALTIRKAQINNLRNMGAPHLKQLKLNRQVLLRILAEVVHQLHAFRRKVVDV